MNIYDEQLHKIEEAEENVRIAKARLLEAEKELDETLELVESELNEEKKSLKEIEIIGKTQYAIVVKIGKRGKHEWEKHEAWEPINDKGEIDNKEPRGFDSEEEAKKSELFRIARRNYPDAKIVHANKINNTNEEL